MLALAETEYIFGILQIFDHRVEISRLVKLGSNRVTIRHTEDMSEYLIVLHAHVCLPFSLDALA